ncbi:hypothetical protein SAMN05414139_03447 [Burkholderia sp. D7]|nr:hypothetical protein SAMN05414139_03447 [Burkholderia sp. D7]
MIVDDLRRHAEWLKVAGLRLSRPIAFAPMSADGPAVQSDFAGRRNFIRFSILEVLSTQINCSRISPPTASVSSSPTLRSVFAQSILPPSICVTRTILLPLASRRIVRFVMRRFLPGEQPPSDSISAVSQRSPHVPGPPGKVVEQQARTPVPPEPLPTDSVCRKALKWSVPQRHNANRHPGGSNYQRWKRQGARRDEQGKRQADLKCRTLSHYLFSPATAN